jgi:hypothetical protein
MAGEVRLNNGSTPTTPSSGKTSVFVNSSKQLSTVDDTGTVSTFIPLATDIHGATQKTTPVDNDEFGIVDSAESYVLKKTTLANLKTVMTPDSSTTVKGIVELATTAEVTTGTSTTLVPSVASLKGIVQRCGGTIVDPQTTYTKRAQVVMLYTTAAITITGIYVRLNDSTPTSEFAGDLKFADNQFDGSFTNATIIDVVDTTSGAFTATSGFDDPTVPSGKFIYLSMDASPHADIDEIYVLFTYTVD